MSGRKSRGEGARPRGSWPLRQELQRFQSASSNLGECCSDFDVRKTLDTISLCDDSRTVAERLLVTTAAKVEKRSRQHGMVSLHKKGGNKAERYWDTPPA